MLDDPRDWASRSASAAGSSTGPTQSASTPPSGVEGASRSLASPSLSSVAASPNETSSSGIGGRSRSTSLSEETITTKRSAAAATIFSRVGAATTLHEPGVGRELVGPSTATSRAWRLPSSATSSSPTARAAVSVSGDVATQRRSRLREASEQKEVRDGRSGAEADRHPVFDQLCGCLGGQPLLALDVGAHVGATLRRLPSTGWDGATGQAPSRSSPRSTRRTSRGSAISSARWSRRARETISMRETGHFIPEITDRTGRPRLDLAAGARLGSGARLPSDGRAAGAALRVGRRSRWGQRDIPCRSMFRILPARSPRHARSGSAWASPSAPTRRSRKPSRLPTALTWCSACRSTPATRARHSCQMPREDRASARAPAR